MAGPTGLGSGIDKNDLLNCRENGLEASFQEFSFIPYNHAKAYGVAEIHASARRDNLAGQQL
jgi:hypothetical protein